MSDETTYAAGLREFVDRVNAVMPPDFYRRDLATQRRLYENLAVEFPYDVPAGVRVSEHTHPGTSRTLRLRLYQPAEPVRDGLLFYIRGGGFVLGSLDSHHAVAAELAARSGLRVVAVDFPLAPEHPFPAAVDDCAEAFAAITDASWDLGVRIDPDDVIVAGDSSGANMAVVLTMRRRDQGCAPPAGMALVSPVLDFTRWCSGGEDAPLLTGGEMEYYTACYCPDAVRVGHPHVSPLVSGSFHGLPPTLVMGGSLDSLRVDGDQLCDRLRAHGTPAQHHVEEGLVHSAIRARGHSPAVADAWSRFCAALPGVPAMAPARAGARGDHPVVIVDPYSSGAQLAPALLARGIPVVSVMTAHEPPAVYAASHRPGDFPATFVWQGDDEGVLDVLRPFSPRGVIAGCESGVELAERLASTLVPHRCNVPDLAAARRHKGAMAAAVAAAGIPVIPQLTTSSPAEVSAWIRRHRLQAEDLIIKPPKSASTDGVVRVPAPHWRAAFDSRLGTVNRLGLVNDELVVQHYVTGTEYVVDTFSHDGVHTVTDVCRYSKILDGEAVAVYDTLEWVAPEEPDVAAVTAYAREVLTAVGLRIGPAHVEIMMTGHGPRLIEVGARAHGGGHPRFCEIATGDSQVRRTARYFAGELPLPPGYQLRRHMLVVFHLCRRPGLVTSLDALAEMDRLPSVVDSVHHYELGSALVPTTDLFSSLDLGFVVLAGPDPARLREDYRRIRDLEQALTAPLSGVPVG